MKTGKDHLRRRRQEQEQSAEHRIWARARVDGEKVQTEWGIRLKQTWEQSRNHHELADGETRE
jgi:hypothetical protein